MFDVIQEKFKELCHLKSGVVSLGHQQHLGKKLEELDLDLFLHEVILLGLLEELGLGLGLIGTRLFHSLLLKLVLNLRVELLLNGLREWLLFFIRLEQLVEDPEVTPVASSKPMLASLGGTPSSSSLLLKTETFSETIQ